MGQYCYIYNTLLRILSTKDMKEGLQILDTDRGGLNLFYFGVQKEIGRF